MMGVRRDGTSNGNEGEGGGGVHTQSVKETTSHGHTNFIPRYGGSVCGGGAQWGPFPGCCVLCSAWGSGVCFRMHKAAVVVATVCIYRPWKLRVVHNLNVFHHQTGFLGPLFVGVVLVCVAHAHGHIISIHIFYSFNPILSPFSVVFPPSVPRRPGRKPYAPIPPPRTSPRWPAPPSPSPARCRGKTP